MKRILLFSLSVLLFWTPITSSNESHIDKLVSEFIQYTMLQATSHTTSKSIRYMMQNSDLGLLPQMVEQATQQITLQVYKQPSLKDFTNDIYTRAKDLIDTQMAEGVAQDIVQSNAKKQIDEEMHALFYDPIFHNLVEHGLNIALQQQSQVILQESLRQQLTKD